VPEQLFAALRQLARLGRRGQQRERVEPRGHVQPGGALGGFPAAGAEGVGLAGEEAGLLVEATAVERADRRVGGLVTAVEERQRGVVDRKSTRLNSSH